MFSVIIKPIKRCSSTIKAIKSMFASVLPPLSKKFQNSVSRASEHHMLRLLDQRYWGRGSIIIRVGNCISLLIKGMHVVITISNNFDNYRDKETTDLANCPKIKYSSRE